MASSKTPAGELKRLIKQDPRTAVLALEILGSPPGLRSARDVQRQHAETRVNPQTAK